MLLLRIDCLKSRPCIVTFLLSMLSVDLSFQNISGLEEENDLLEVSEAGEEAGLPDAVVASWCLLRSIIAFSSISSVPRMCPGLLFLTSVSYTDPDQFVYKTQPPREQPGTSPDVMMNSYLGL